MFWWQEGLHCREGQVNRSKHSKPYRKRSKAPTDKRAMDRMSMGRKVTRESYEAIEIVQDAPSAKERKQVNRSRLDAVQSGYKPMVNGRVRPGGN